MILASEGNKIKDAIHVGYLTAIGLVLLGGSVYFVFLYPITM